MWGRRRVGKTALLQRFAEGRRTIFHTASGRPQDDELAALPRAAHPVTGGYRSLAERPFTDWQDALETLAAAAEHEPLLLVMDEIPELASVTPALPKMLCATWDRIGSRTRLSILLCGSATRTMAAMAEEGAPLFGRLDLRLALQPFRPHEAALMLPSLAPADRAAVYGLPGGIPLYLTWWDQGRSIRENLRRLACTPGGLLLTEGELALATETDVGDLGRQVLYAIASGRTSRSTQRAEPRVQWRYLTVRRNTVMISAMPNESEYSIGELATLAGVTPRTIRYYVSIGLLSSPGQSGPQTRYGDSHLARLRLIRKLQREHLPLGEIAQRLDGLGDDSVEQALEAGEATATPGSALDYIRHLQSETAAPQMELRMFAASGPAPIGSAMTGPAPKASAPRASAPDQTQRTQWDRVPLSQNVELHIRRPLGRLEQKRVERLIRIGREILEEGDQP